MNATWFHNLMDARAKIRAWREEYNGERPHSSLGYRTPNEFAAAGILSYEWLIKARHVSSKQNCWTAKRQRNVLRDLELIRSLQQLAWEVLVLWECDASQHGLLKSQIKSFLKKSR
ncbi:MAG: integrase core domain-containing protein [Bryobacteraceae bacterium]